MDKKKITFTLLALLLILSLLSTGCTAGPTEAQVAADLCRRGNEKACTFHDELLNMEKAVASLEKAREAYEGSLTTPTPPP